MQQKMTEEQQRELQERIKNMSPEELKEFQKQQCIFCQIIDGKVPSKKIFEDKICIAVMDVNPAAPGHVLLLPKEHYAIMPQVPDDEIGHLFMAAKEISQAMLRKLGVEGTNIFVANGGVAGQRAQHFMIHIIPRKEGDEVLDLPEHIVEIQMREKLAEVIGKRADKLFGIKRETQEKLPAPEKEVEKSEPEEEAVEEPEVEEEIQEEVVGKKPKKKSTKGKAKKTPAKKKSTKKSKKGDKASLDDIANLFK